MGCPVIFRHGSKEIVVVVHGDDFVMGGIETDLWEVAKKLEKKFTIQVRAVMGSERKDAKEEDLLGRRVRWKEWGIEWQAGEKHRRLLLEKYGLQEGSKALRVNGPIEEFNSERPGGGSDW